MFYAAMISQNLHDLVVFLATVSVISWLVVLVTTALRFGALLRYPRPKILDPLEVPKP